MQKYFYMYKVTFLKKKKKKNRNFKTVNFFYLFFHPIPEYLYYCVMMKGKS